VHYKSQPEIKTPRRRQNVISRLCPSIFTLSVSSIIQSTHTRSYQTASGVAMGWAKSRRPPSEGAPEFQVTPLQTARHARSATVCCCLRCVALTVERVCGRTSRSADRTCVVPWSQGVLLLRDVWRALFRQWSDCHDVGSLWTHEV